MPTPLTGIVTPTYSPSAWTDMAAMAASLEALTVVPFATETARDAAIPTPSAGRMAFVADVSGGVCVYDGTTWRYLEYRP